MVFSKRRVVAFHATTVVVFVSCASEPTRSNFEPKDDAGAREEASGSHSPFADASVPGKDAGCFDPAIVLSPMTEAVFAPSFASLYTAYDLGPVPGVPGEIGQSLGAVYVKSDEPNALYVIGDSERPTSALYRIGVKRDACNHIVAFDGKATLVSKVPYADASLVATPNGWLYTLFPLAKLGHVNAANGVKETPLVPFGVQGPFDYKGDQFPGDSPGGLAVVPAYLPGSGSLLTVAYPSGTFFRLTLGTSPTSIGVTAAQKLTTIPNGPGAFAYVPVGSPGFTAPSLIITEWFNGSAWKAEYYDPPDGAPQAVAVYEVTDDGLPKPATRRAFFTQFPRPWGAFFEPLTGDFLFATWRGSQGQKPDRIVQVRGFVAPPQLPSPK